MNFVVKENAFPAQLAYHYFSVINWILHILTLGTLITIFFRKFNEGLPIALYISSLLLKLTAGLMVGWIFFNYYGAGDTLLFFEKSKELASLPPEKYIDVIFSPSTYTVSDQPRVLFFTKFLSLLILLTKGSYWISSLYISLISFFGTWYLITVIKRHYRSVLVCAIICFLFVPSIVFWSSGILKDTLAFGAMTVLIGLTLKIYQKKAVSFIEGLFALLGIFVLLKLKHYLLISFLVFSGLLVFLSFIRKSTTRHQLIAIGIMAFVIICSQFIHPYLKFDRLATTLFENNKAIRDKTEASNQVSITIESPEVISVLKEVPEALQIGLFRPAIFDPTPVWGLIPRIENTLITMLFCFSILLYFKKRPVLDTSLIIAAVASILLLATMLALSTPNFGTLVRYKNAFLPFFALLSSILPYQFFATKYET